MGRNGGQVAQVGTAQLETIQETVEPAEMALVPDQRLGGPGVGRVHNAHALQHHEAMHAPTRRRRSTHISSDCAQLADKRVTNQGLREKQAPGEVPVP
jgi:hypothetical protein